MSAKSMAKAHWEGSLIEGRGEVALQSSGAATLPVNWKARAEGSDTTTTPEELLGAAHAACFSMALSNALTEAGTPPETIDVIAAVGFQPGAGITGSHLSVVATVPGLSRDRFAGFIEETRVGCPVSAALTGIPITVSATLVER